MTDLRDLCARMADELDRYRQYLMDDRSEVHALAAEARAALAEPEPEGPTDEELLCIAAKAIDGYGTCGIKPGEYEPATECAVEAYGSELCDFARAVLARLGRSAPQPIPLDERLPGAGDCDAEGRCWWGAHVLLGGIVPVSWRFVSTEDRNGSELYWLPVHALPLPS